MSELIKLDEENFKENINKGVSIVKFGAEWCGPCKQIKPILEEIFDEKKEDLKVFDIDIDLNPNLSIEFGIRSIPTIIIFKDGIEIDRNIGMISKVNILNKL